MDNINISKEFEKLSPSAELLEFYRKKIKEHDKDKEEMLYLLEKFQKLYSSSFAEKEREKLNHDLAELKTALSDVNVFIHAERQQVASLHLQNEELKVEQRLSDKKIAFLLQVCNLSEDQLSAYLRSNNKKNILQQLSQSRNGKVSKTILKAVEASDRETYLEDKVRVLEEHLKVLKSSCEDEKHVLLEERVLQKAEAKAQREQDQAHINLLNARLVDSQRLAQDLTRSAVEAKSNLQKAKNGWLAEKDKLMMDQERLRRRFSLGKSSDLRRSGSFTDLSSLRSTCEVKQLRRELSATERRLKEAEEMKQVFESRFRNLEHESRRGMEHRDAELAIFKEKFEKLKESKELLKKQRDNAESRRRLEAEGFSSELRIVKDDLRKVVHQFFKLTRFYSESQDLPNVAEIQDLKLATALARNIHHAIINAKRNMIKAETSFGDERD